MSQTDRDRLVALNKADKRLITQRAAAAECELSERQFRRLLKRYRAEKDQAVIHKLRGRASNRKLEDKTRQKAIEILQQQVYRGFGPTLASEYLAKKHDLQVSKETLRNWMIGAGLWRDQKARAKRAHLWRARRERYGELVQWDTSTHDWLEGRGERIYLIKMIDDATSCLYARFVRADSTAANLEVLDQYVRRFGRPLGFYTDKAAHFVSTPKKTRDPDAEPLQPTQIQRALTELRIGWIAAHSPQAKGRVERSFKTAQDRLVKGLRAARASTIEQANTYLEAEYLPEWERKFTVVPQCSDDAHRPLADDCNLEAILAHVEHRVITPDYTVRDNGKIWKIARADVHPQMRGVRVRVEHRRNGEVAIRFEGRYVSVTECPAQPKRSLTPRPPITGARKAHNAGGKSAWMKQEFWKRPTPTLKQALTISNAND